jgi:DNA-directed RNA polymerase specialized sigma24 family protein
MADASIASTTPADTPAPEIAHAFRNVHGRRLHGFALLLTLGDRALAARLVADALATAATRTDELRHPERAAAWLRARVLRGMPRRRHVASPAEERAAFESLEIDPAVVDGLAALDARERAALIAADVELLDPRDVETVAGRQGERLERLLVRARRRYLAGYAAAPIGADADADGTLVRRIRAVAARTMA